MNENKRSELYKFVRIQSKKHNRFSETDILGKVWNQTPRF